MVLAVFFATSGGLYVMAEAELPPEDKLAQTTILFDASGRRVASLDAGENRVPVPLERIPGVVVQAVLATEDRNFYRHGGLDPAAIVRATIADLRGRPLQGGSTITQQYVKNAYSSVGRERTIARKLREAGLAVKLERAYGKDEILERYLNTVYFGRGAYGVQAAARAWFSKDVEDLTLREAAYLAGLIRAPETADASRNPEAAIRRRDRTLKAMDALGLITTAQRRAVEAVPLVGPGGYVVTREEREPEVVATDKGTLYFVEHVRQELVRRYGEAVVTGGGLRVVTSLDLDLQAKAWDAVHGVLDAPTDPAGALVAIDGNGDVKAMVGGRDYQQSKVNYALGRDGGGSGRQAGSTFKAFVLAAIVRDGYSVRSTFPAPAEIVLPKANSGRDYRVENYEGADYGESLDLVAATRSSVNTVYVGAQIALGTDKVVDMAQDLGITSPLLGTASLGLGTAEVSVLEMAAAYSTFANRGVRTQPRVILEVRRADGTIVHPRSEPARHRVLDEAEADVVTWCLQQAVEGGTGTAARVRGTDVAGKTGTTQDYGDAWFVGYTPELTAAVWMGYPEGNTRKMTNVRGRRVSGGSFPATIFSRFMTAATEDGDYRGQFPGVKRVGAKVLKPSSKVKLITTTTTTTTTTMVAPEAGADGTSATTAPPTTAKAPGSTTSTTTTSTTEQPQESTTTTTKAPKPPGGPSHGDG